MMNLEAAPRSLRHVSVALALLVGGCATSGVTGTSQDELEGELEVLEFSYVVTSETEYVLRTDDGDLRTLDFGGEPILVTGDRIRARGHQVDDHFVVDDYDMVSDDESSVSQALIGNAVRRSTRLAVLLVNWTAPDSMTVDTMRARVFTNSNSTSVFYRDNSYNLHAIDGNVFGWFQIPALASCDFRALATSARAAAQSAGVDLSGFTQFLYYFPRTSLCGWSGLALVGSPTTPARDTWYNGSSGCVVLAQEILHNFGARHSHSYSCSDSTGARVPIAPAAQCTFSEYGDPYDPMGGGCYHVNAYQKAAQGWFGGCNAVTLTSDGEFDIVPTTVASNGIQTLRVPAGANLCPSGVASCYYHVEYRQPLGPFDGANPTAPVHQGVMLHVAPPADFSGRSRPGDPYLLDLSPATAGFRDPDLLVGQTFTDPNGIQISLVSRSSASAHVRVRFPGGGSGAPVCIDGSRPGQPPPPPPPTCGAGETGFEGGCYVLTAAAQPYDQARASCQALGTGWRVAEIGSASENNFVSGLAGTFEAWLGASDGVTEGQFAWDSGPQFWTGGAAGSPVSGSFANFVIGEPNDAGGNSDCIRMVAGGGWRDIQCTSSFRAICERR
jgi:hypothetical protein